MQVYAGIDWSREFHVLCVLDVDGKTLFEGSFCHTRPGLEGLVAKLKEFGASKGEIRVAIELTRGSVVEALSRERFPVVPVHPNHLAHARGCFGAAGSKSDQKDAMVLAEVLRTNSHRLRELSLDSEDTRILKRLDDHRQQLMDEHQRACQRLAAVLAEVFPAAVGLFSSLDCLISLAFLEKYPTAKAAELLTEGSLQAFLQGEKYSGGTSAQTFLAKLKEGAPPVVVTSAEAFVVRDRVQQLKELWKSLRHVETEIAQALKIHPDRKIYASLPGVQTTTVASLAANLGNLACYSTPEHLMADGGLVPVVKQSGKARFVAFRTACNKDLRRVLTTFADVARRKDPWAASIYTAARSRRIKHRHALRILARAWSRVIFRMVKDRTTYDPTRHKRTAA